VASTEVPPQQPPTFQANELLVAEHGESAVDEVISGEPLVLDRDEAIRRVDGNLELLAKISALFQADSAKLIGDIREALTAGDPLRLKRAAHTFKGAVSYFGAPCAYRLAADLEAAGHEGHLGRGEPLLRQLEGVLEQILPQMAQFTNHEFAE